MRFDVLTGQPVVTVTLDARTAVDHRMKRLDLSETLRDVLRDHNCPIERHADGLRYVKNLACGQESCGATWDDRGNHPAMRYVTPSSEVIYPRNPRFVRCVVCGGPPELSSDVFPRVVPKNRARELDRYAVTALHNRDYTAVRCAGKVAVGEKSFQQSAEQVVPKRVNLDKEIEALLIRACSLDVATEALGRSDFPNEVWVTVPVTHELWPKAAWHNQPMTMTDSAPIRRHQKQRVAEAEAAVEAEVRAFRDELSARQRA
jgi:hypothetical protein